MVSIACCSVSARSGVLHPMQGETKGWWKLALPCLLPLLAQKLLLESVRAAGQPGEGNCTVVDGVADAQNGQGSFLLHDARAGAWPGPRPRSAQLSCMGFSEALTVPPRKSVSFREKSGLLCVPESRSPRQRLSRPGLASRAQPCLLPPAA